MKFNPSGATDADVDLDLPGRLAGLEARCFRAFPAREQL